jgi:hypothetical protein
VKWILLGTTASTSGYLVLLQSQIIPDSLWAQYPIVAIFLLAGGVAGYYHLKEQDKNRKALFDLIAILREERQEHQQALERILREQNEASAKLLEMMQAGEKDSFDRFAAVQARTFEEAIERISGQIYSWQYQQVK